MDLSLIARDSVFPFARAVRAGIGPDELRRLLRQGECHRLHRGWFTTADVSDDLVRHRLRVAALLQQYAGAAVGSHVSALIRLELPTYEPDLSVVHLMAVDPQRRGHRKADLLVHPRPGPPIRSRRSSGRPARGATLGGASPAAGDEQAGESSGAGSMVGSMVGSMAGSRAGSWAASMAHLGDTPRGTTHAAMALAFTGLADPLAFLVPADAALRAGLASREDLAAAVSVLGRRPGVPRLRAALPLCDDRHESPGETVTGFVLRTLGFRIVPQVSVPNTESWTPGGQGYRADFGIVGTTVLVEFDGRVKYASAEALWREKQREDRIRSLGYEVVRLTWADLKNPDRVRVLVEGALRRADARSRGRG